MALKSAGSNHCTCNKSNFTMSDSSAGARTRPQKDGKCPWIIVSWGGTLQKGSNRARLLRNRGMVNTQISIYFCTKKSYSLSLSLFNVSPVGSLNLNATLHETLTVKIDFPTSPASGTCVSNLRVCVRRPKSTDSCPFKRNGEHDYGILDGVAQDICALYMSIGFSDRFK